MTLDRILQILIGHEIGHRSQMLLMRRLQTQTGKGEAVAGSGRIGHTDSYPSPPFKGRIRNTSQLSIASGDGRLIQNLRIERTNGASENALTA
jgi:hypothetical protein